MVSGFKGKAMKLVNETKSMSLKQRRETLIADYKQWDQNGRVVKPSSKILTGLFYLLYRQRNRLLPISPLEDDIDAFTSMLILLKEDPSIAPWCIQAIFELPNFRITADSFSNPNVFTKWAVIERARKLRDSNGPGEQAEFRTDARAYGVMHV